MNTFVSFDGTRIAYHDEGEGPAVILLHGFGVDGLGQYGDFERIRPILEKQQEMFKEVFGGAPPLPDPPVEGRPGMVRALRAAGARTIIPDTRGFGASDKPREVAAYADSSAGPQRTVLTPRNRSTDCLVLTPLTWALLHWSTRNSEQMISHMSGEGLAI